MCSKKIALIGHSGAGKTSCLLQLGVDLQRAEMDIALSPEQSPPLATALRWLAEGSTDQTIVVVSNHEKMLKEMQEAKAAGEFGEYFAKIHFVYLWKPKDRLTPHLEKPHPGGKLRDSANKQCTLATYDRFHQLFHSMADSTIEVAAKSVQEVAAEITALSESACPCAG
jgi:hypothetical protein